MQQEPTNCFERFLLFTLDGKYMENLVWSHRCGHFSYLRPGRRRANNPKRQYLKQWLVKMCGFMVKANNAPVAERQGSGRSCCSDADCCVTSPTSSQSHSESANELVLFFTTCGTRQLQVYPMELCLGIWGVYLHRCINDLSYTGSIHRLK